MRRACFAVVASIALVAALPAAAEVPAAGYAGDAVVLRDAYATLHPGFLRYQTPDQAGARFAELRDALARAASQGDAFLALTAYTASVRCGHSYPSFFNQSGAMAAALFGGRNRVPFAFRWIVGRMIVTADLGSGDALHPGDEVLAIDGRPVGDILAHLLPYARADGGNDAQRIDQLQVRGESRYEAFDVYFALAYPKHIATFDLRVRPYGARGVRSLTVAAQSDADRAARSAARDAAESGNAPLWTLRRLDARTAMLSMPTWVTYKSTWDWHAFLHDAFAGLATGGTRDLVIDLRGNEGGTTAVAGALIAHLIDVPVTGAPVRRLVRYRAVPAALAPYLSTYDPSPENWGAAATYYDARFYQLTGAGESAAPIAPESPRFRGRVWVLVDAANSSATFLFDQIVRDRRLGTLVGAPTGGNRRGINGGAFVFVHLPASGIEVDLPLVGEFPVTPQPDAGIVPDIAAPYTQRAIARGADPALDAVRARIAAGA